jgi:hypothetical protein
LIHFLAISSLLALILRNTLFADICNVYASVAVRDHVSQPYKTTDKQVKGTMAVSEVNRVLVSVCTLDQQRTSMLKSSATFLEHFFWDTAALNILVI